jgi:hypothetical protein
MTDAFSIGWTDARANESRTLYRRVLGLNLILHLLIGLACIFLPHWVSHTFGLPGPIPTGWVRGWGATLILIGLLGRLWMAIIWTFCGGGFLWFALFDFAFFLILSVLYLRFGRAVLMSRP